MGTINKIDLKVASDHASSMEAQRAPHRPWWRRFWLLAPLFVLSLGIAAYSMVAQIGQINQSTTGTSFISQLGHLIASQDKPLAGEASDRINFLLMGIGGAGHDGPLLTDTIIVASLKPSTNQVAMISIPRDLLVKFPNDTYRKINNAVYLGGLLNYTGGGEQLLADIITDVTGLQIDYFARIDFAGFAEAIDELGGINVTVDTAFADYEYPTDNYGYQTISFLAGPQMMDGDTALKFVRSRHGNNGEGSDFARSARQQKVLAALRDKALSLGTLTNPVKLQRIISALSSHIKTNAELWELARLSEILKDADTEHIKTAVLDNSPEGLLKHTTGIDGAYLLEPVSGTYNEIHALARDIFSAPSTEIESATVAIHNGTAYTGLARTTANKITSKKLYVVEVANAPTKDSDQTIIYDLTGGQKPAALAYLKRTLGTNRVASNLPFFLDEYNELSYNNINAAQNPVLGITTSEAVDFLVVLGADAALTSSTTSILFDHPGYAS